MFVDHDHGKSVSVILAFTTLANSCCILSLKVSKNGQFYIFQTSSSKRGVRVCDDIVANNRHESC